MANNNVISDHECNEAIIHPDLLTMHAQQRIQERNIKAELLDNLVAYGHCQARKSRYMPRRNSRETWRSSVESYSFTRKTWERFANDHPDLAMRYHRCRNVFAIVSNGCVITAAYCRAPRHKRRR